MSTILPHPRLSKSTKLVDILGASPDLIPINDLDAYTNNPKFRGIYNRLELAEWQGLPCGPMPLEPNPDDFPIIIKPIINLYGLSLNCYKVNNLDEFYDQYWLNTGFWMKYLEGPSTSTDVILKDGKIVWSCTFKGYIGDEPGVYSHWKLKKQNYRLPKTERRFIKEKLAGYTGIVNIESIQGHIIESHLRMGDLDHIVEMNALRALVKFYQTDGLEWDLDDTSFKPCKVYLVPVFLKPDEEFILEEKEVKLNAIGCISYQIDTGTTAHPPTKRRVVLLTCSQLDLGFQARDRILEENINSMEQSRGKREKCIIS